MKTERLGDARLSLSDIRDTCEVAIGTVHKWVDEFGLESLKEGRERTVSLADLLRFLADRYPNDAAESRNRLAAAKADRAEFENEVRRGEFIPVVVHGDLLHRVCGEVVGQMSGFPGRVAPKIASIKDPALLRTLLIDECNEVRNGVAKLLGDIADTLHELVETTTAPTEVND